MTLLDIIKKIKIDLTQGYVNTDQWLAPYHDFEITPKDFLNYGKLDYKQNDKRGLINSLTNAKRAIDCQTDKIFLSFGINPDDFPKIINDYISKSTSSPAKKDLPAKLRFLQAINFAPAEIVTNVRNLRHKLEHYYKEPTSAEASSAIELAELFILATDSKLKGMLEFALTDREKYSKNEETLRDSVFFQFDREKHWFEVTGRFGKKDKKTIKIKNTDIEFYGILKIASSFDYDEDVQDSIIELMGLIGHPIPAKNIKIDVD
jgi:hypothetical protein